MSPASASGVTTRRRRRRKRVPTAGPDLDKENKRDNGEKNKVTIDTFTTVIDLKKFTIDDHGTFGSAARSCKASSFWKKQSSSYMDAILDCSRTFSKGTAPLQLLESEEALLSACRQSVKEATEQKTFGDNLIRELMVATHALRALTTIVVDTSLTPIKLVYHAMVTLSDRMQNDKCNKNISELSLAISIGVALYETLGRFLDDSRLCRFGSSTALFSFPVPTCNTTCEDLQQLLKIGIQSSLALCNVLRLHIAPFSTSTFGASVASVMMRNTTVEIIKDIVLQVIVPWARTYAANSESHKELVSFSKAAHRLLWDVASTQASHDDALELRRDAILALVLCANDDETEHDTRLQISTAWSELASTYAWKAAATYVQQTKLTVPVESTHALCRFHTEIGHVLVRIAQPCCMSYIEYCACRSLHVGMRMTASVCSCNLFGNCPHEYSQVFSNSGAATSLPTLGEATLRLIFMVASLEGELATGLPGSALLESHQHYNSVLHLEQIRDAALADFQSVVVMQRTPEDLRRCYKILQQAMLPQRCSRQRKALDDIDALHLSSTCHSVWEVCGSILSTAIVTMLHMLIQTESDAKRRLDFCDDIIDTYSRVLSLYDALDSKSSDSPLARKIDQLILQIHEAVDLTTPTVGSVERLAKLVFSIGKRRQDSNTSGIIPLVYSLLFLTRLESSSRDQEFARSSQLMSRYSYLASCLVSLDMKVAAVLAIVAALAYDSTSEVEIDTHPLDATSSFLMDLSSGTPQTRNATVSLIHRLIPLLQEGMPIEAPDKAASLVSVSDAIKDAATGKAIGCSPDLEGLLSGTFVDVVRRCDPRCCDSVRGQQARTAGLLLASLGDTIKRQSSEEGSTTSLHHVFRSSSRLLYRALKRMKAPNDNATYMLSVSHFVAASSLTPIQNDLKAEVRTLYWNQLARAAKSLDELRGNYQANKMTSFLWLDVVYRQICLVGVCRDVTLISACEQVVREFLGSEVRVDDNLQTKIWDAFKRCCQRCDLTSS
jgi:hypothetical protein